MSLGSPAHKIRLRFYAWLTLLTLSASVVELPRFEKEAFAAPLFSTPMAAVRAELFPAHFGTLETIHDAGPGRPQVVIIQDAHAVTQAQNNIQNLIRYFEETAGIRLVGVEGADGPLDALLFRTFPDEFIKKQVLLSYLEEGELTGAEMAAALNPARSSYAGLEDWNTYESNHRAYHLARGAQDAAAQALGRAYEIWQAEARRRFSAELLEFHAAREKFYRDEVTLAEMLPALKPHLVRLPAEFRNKVSGLKSLIMSLEEEKNSPLENVKMQADIRKMAEVLGEKINQTAEAGEAAAFNQARQSFLTGRIETAAYLGELIRYGARHGLEPRLTPEMQLALARSETLSTLRGGEIFRELELCFNAVQDLLGPEPAHKEIFISFERLRRLRDLSRLEMTRDSLDVFQADPEGHLSLAGASRASFEPALEFYQYALERDLIFFCNLEGLLKKQKRGSAVVVAGGFHARGLEQKLRDAGYSFAVISPAIHSLQGHEVYDLRMKGEVSYRDYLETTYYDAFARHAGVKFMEKVSEPEFKKNLRMWRDEIIRELARDGEIAKVGQYTRYIDLLFSVYQRRFGGGQGEAYTPEGLRQALTEEIRRIRNETEHTWRDSFTEALARFTDALGRMEKRGELNAAGLRTLIENPAKAQTLSAHLAFAANEVLPWHKPGGRLPSGSSRVNPALVPFSTGEIMTDALSQLADESLSAPDAVGAAAVRSAAVLAAVARQAEALNASPEAPLVRDAGAARESLRKALEGLPAGPPEMAREILERGEAMIRGTSSVTAASVRFPEQMPPVLTDEREPRETESTSSVRSELRESGALTFDDEINRRFMELQWVWYGAGDDGVPHEDNLYRQIGEARQRHFPTPDKQFDPAAVQAYNADIYRVLDDSYNNPAARRVLENISALPGVDYRIFFFHGAIFDAFRATMETGRSSSPALDYGDDMPSTPGFYRYDTYDLGDFHQVFVELVQNNQRHMKPNNMIVAVKREAKNNVDLIYYYGNLNTDDAANIEESLYGGEYANDYSGSREHAFFNTIAPAVFRLGGTIRVEFSGKAWEFYPRNWAAWRWLRSIPSLWEWAWFTFGKWFFRSGAGRRDLGPSNLSPGRGIKITLSLPRYKLKRQTRIPGAPVGVEFTRVRLPGSLQDVMVYSVFDEAAKTVKVQVTTEELRGALATVFTVDLNLPAKAEQVAARHREVVDVISRAPSDLVKALLELDAKAEYQEGRSFDLSGVEMSEPLALHLLQRFLPGLDLKTVGVTGARDTFLLKIPAAGPEFEARLDALREHIRSTFIHYEAMLEKPGWLGQEFRLTLMPKDGILEARSELRADPPPPPSVLRYLGPREGLWKKIEEVLGLEKRMLGGTSKIYLSSKYPDYVLKKKEVPETEIFRIEAPWNNQIEYLEVSRALEEAKLGVAERALYLRTSTDPAEVPVRTNLTWQRKIVPLDHIWDLNPEKREALTLAAGDLLKRTWKAGYFDADFKLANIGRYKNAEEKASLRVIDFDFAYPLPDTDDPEVVYQWLKNRDLKDNGRLHQSAGEHFLINLFYYEDPADDDPSNEDLKRKIEVGRLAPIRKELFPTFDEEKARQILIRVYDAARSEYTKLQLTGEEKKDPPLEKVRIVKQAILDAADRQPFFERGLRMLAERIVEARRSEMRTQRENLETFLNDEEPAMLDRRLEELREIYREGGLSLQAKNLMLYPTIFLVLLGLKPAYLRYHGEGPNPSRLVEELRLAGLLSADLQWLPEAGLFYDAQSAGRALISDKSRLLRETGILSESQAGALERIRQGVESSDEETVRRETIALVSRLLARIEEIPDQAENLQAADALNGVLLGYPEESIRAILRWRGQYVLGRDTERVSPLVRYPDIGLVTDLTMPSIRATLEHHSLLENYLDYAYGFFEGEKHFSEIARAQKLPQGRSELRADEDLPEAELPPDELGLAPNDWLDRLRRIRLFWEGENAERFGELKALIAEYREVMGMRSMVSRLASSYLSGNRASFNEVAGELFITKRLVDHLSPEYDVEVLGLGLYAGFREIDGFLKITPKPGVALSGTPLAPGLYILEAKEDSAADLRRLITDTIRNQVGPQIENARFFTEAGLPLRGAIVGVGGVNSRLIPGAGLRQEKSPEGAVMPVYSFAAESFSIQESSWPETLPPPAEEQIRIWNRQKLNIETFFYRTLLPAFGLPAVAEGDDERRRSTALNELERRERVQREIARRNIRRKKKEREERIRDLEKRASEIEGWEETFETLSDSEAAANPALVGNALRWFFNRRSLPLENLRRQLQDAAKDPSLPQTFVPVPDDSSSAEIVEADLEGDIYLEAHSSSSPEGRNRAWLWLKAQYEQSLSRAAPVRSEASRPRAQAEQQRAQVPRTPRPPADPAVREARGWVGSFINHDDVEPRLTDADAVYVENVLWIYFQGRIDAGQLVGGENGTRRTLQAIFAQLGRNGAWEWVQAQAEEIYGGAVDRSELRSETAGFDASSGRAELKNQDAGPLLRWLPELEERVAEDVRKAGTSFSAAQTIWEPEGLAAIARRAGELEDSLREIVLEGIENHSASKPYLPDETTWSVEDLQAAIGEDPAFLDAYAVRDRLLGRVSALAEGRSVQPEQSISFSAPEELFERVKWLLAPANRTLLEKAFLARFGREIRITESRRLVMDLSFFEETAPEAAEKFAAARVSEGGLILAYLKATETAPSLSRIFRLAGVGKKQYTLEEGIELEGEKEAAAVYMLAAGTPVEAKNVGRENGVFVGKEVFYGSRLEAPEFAVLVEMALEVEALRRQLEDIPGAYFPEFTQRTLQSAFGLLQDLLETELVKEAFATAA